jgi:hypothetical protein
MDSLFSPSVNIVRDADRSLAYLPTPNAVTVFGQILNNYRAGIHCFNIVGAYGTGKSSFLWAFEQTLSGQQEFFPLRAGGFGIRGFQFERFVGQYASLKETIGQRFGLPDAGPSTTSAAVIAAIGAAYQPLAAEGKALILLVDEFGKFLEYAARENPEEEPYFLQELAEYLNSPDQHILLLTTVHQDVSAYALDLTRAQRNEWEKVKGRLKELTFNEPVEQLLALAAQQLAGRKWPDAPSAATNKRLFRAVEAAQVFPLRDYFSADTQRQVWPLDLLAAAVLVQALQRYGQNERSLFSFLSANDYLGIEQLAAAGAYYSVSRVYDYLSFHFYALLTSRHNPHFAQWAITRDILDQLEKHFNSHTDLEAARQLVKTIGLLSIFAPAGAELSADFLEAYAQTALGLPAAAPLLAILEQHKLIRFQKHKNSFILFGGTDLDIELAIDEAGLLVEQVTDVAARLREFFPFPYISAKQVSFAMGTPRVFEVRMSSDAPLLETPQDEVDGFVNLIFSDTLTVADLHAAVGERREAVLYGIYRRSGEIKKLILEIDKVRRVRRDHPQDKVAVRELDGILEHQEALLRHYVLGSLYAADGSIRWFFNGAASTAFQGRRGLNRCLSAIAAEVYAATPVYRSELVNRTRLSSPIATARKNFLRALYENWQYPNLNFPAKNFPPEKTIYLSLLKETGIHQVINGELTLGAPASEAFQQLWKLSEDFLRDTEESPLKISDFIERLKQRPFKLKQGFIDFWVPVFLFIKRHEFALYGEQGKYIPELRPEVVDLFTKSPELYTVKAFALLPEKLALFNEYRELLQLERTDRTSNEGFIESIKPFLTFYRQLPLYSKHTRNLLPLTLRLRETIATAKDPEAAFFEQFPGALGFNILELQRDAATRELYITVLQDHMARLRQAYPALLLRLEEFIGTCVTGRATSFEEYQQKLQTRFRGLSTQGVVPELQVLQQRLMSKLDDREAWLNSIANALVGKSLQAFEDADEKLYRDQFIRQLQELDNLGELATVAIDSETESIVRLAISVPGAKEKTILIRRPKQTNVGELALESQIRTLLGDDKQRSLAILARLLQEQL